MCWPKPSASPASSPGFGFSKPSTWLFGESAAPPRIALLGDVNGDGFADLISVSPEERSIDVALNGRGWKPLKSRRLVVSLPEGVRSACVGRFGGVSSDVALLTASGGLWIARSMAQGALAPVSQIGAVRNAEGTAWVIPWRLRSGSREDLLVITSGGAISVMSSSSGAPISETRVGRDVSDAVAGDVDGDGMSELVVRSGAEIVVLRLGDPPISMTSIRPAAGREALATGDVDGDNRADILANGRVYLGPDMTESIAVPGWGAFKEPVTARLGDLLGNGRADLLLQHRGTPSYAGTGCDAEVYLAYRQTDPDSDFDGLSNREEAELGTDPLQRDTDNDGLLDGWEVRGFQGFDLAAMGASPLHRDLFVQNLLLDGVDSSAVRKRFREELVPLFAALPCPNPDGKPGISLHAQIEPRPYPIEAYENAGGDWRRVHDAMFDPRRAGIWHWVLITGLDAGGHTADGPAGAAGMRSWAHEVGHQLLLTHSGRWPDWSPTYTSLMNYAYSYRFEDDPRKCHFSTGAFSGVVLNETRLPGKLPYSMERLRFLRLPPYSFRMKPAGTDATFVDWGWTGTFSDRPVRADVTYGYGVDAGPRRQPVSGAELAPDGPNEEHSDVAPELVVHRGSLYLLTVPRDPIAPDAPRPGASRLLLRRAAGSGRFDSPTILAADCIGDPVAASDGAVLFVLYPTAAGVAWRVGQPDALGPLRLLPGTKGAAVRAVCLRGDVYAFLWYGADRTIRYCRVTDGAVGPLADLGVTSSIPPGPAFDSARSELLLATAGTKGRETHRWQLRRFALEKGRFRQVRWEWIGGPASGWRGNRRPVVLFDNTDRAGGQGRVIVIARGLAEGYREPANLFIAQSIPYADHHGGWLLKRLYDEWTQTRTAIGAAQFGGEIVLAATWASDSAGSDGAVYVCYNGTGIRDADMSDDNDVSVIADYGLARSIASFTTMPPVRWERDSTVTATATPTRDSRALRTASRLHVLPQAPP